MDLGTERSRHGNSISRILSSWNRHLGDNKRDVLTLSVLLLGDRQSGRSSVGNALIGGEEFKTGTCISGISMTTEHKLLSRNFPKYFRRRGAESDLMLRTLFGPEWRRHALLVLTHADHLKEAGLHPSAYLTQTSDWLKALAEEVGGGVLFLDNSCDWPSVRGRPLRERLLRLSARNHHRALTVRTESHSDL
ncbi:hypothetical protein ABVT39_001601 [Epinephelus coioides]